MTADIMKCQLVKETSCEYSKWNVDEPKTIYKLLCSLGLDKSAEEYFYLICLDTKCNVVGIHEVSHGTLAASLVHPREVFKRAIANNAYAIIIAHNHPSGDASPSEEDFETTRRLRDAGDLLGIKLLDHIIVGDNEWISFKLASYCEL